jgi:hypothetical protein
MIECPNCQHQETEGALYCSECGTKLVDKGLGVTRVKGKNTTNRLAQRAPKGSSAPLPPNLVGSSLSIHILDSGQIIPLTGREEFTLGRSAEGQMVLPDIDLATYKAYEKGVSRMHASIKLSGQQVMVTDLGSVNGTRLNGKKITPHQAQPLSHGDILTLGKMKVQILTRR